MYKIKTFIKATIIGILLFSILWSADGKVDKTEQENLAKQSASAGYLDRKKGIMDGNLILTLFYNYGGIGNWSIADRLNSGIYPKGTGRSYFAEFTPIVGAECHSADKERTGIHIFSDGIVVDSRNQMDKDENGNQLGWNPIPGYANPLQDKIAMSDDPDSWPATWPDKDNSWNGSWNGQYGKYVRGDLETYFVMNDYNNDEFTHYPFQLSDYSHLTGDITVTNDTAGTLELTVDEAIFDPDQINIYSRTNSDVVKVHAAQESNTLFYKIADFGTLNGSGLTNKLILDGSFNRSVIEDQSAVDFSIMDGKDRGLGFQVRVRGYQWAHPAAEDLIIWTYWISNLSDYDYEKTVFGMYGDADVGDDGDQHDDDAWFDRPNAIVYQYDHDMWSAQKGGFKPAYFGWRFLESPGDPMDDKDNDYDGMVDESQSDGIDNDGDWEAEFDDKGSDGIGPNDQDYPGPDEDGTEGNGQPDPGEPDFEYTDNDESDQIGLTSFEAQPWPGILSSDDERVWMQTKPDFFGNIPQTQDLTFLYGSGYFELPSIETDSANSKRKFSVAMVLGEDRQDIFNNAQVIQRIYDADYAFAKPPRKPQVTAVPGDEKVTLYWDKRAENSIDHIYGKDFEGYRIYRATDPNFLESRVISDAYGHLTYNKPIAQFDIENGLEGLHPIDFNGVKFNVGDDTGLQYSFVDTTVTNGQTYYYAVCSYDRGYYENFYENGWSEKDSLPPMQPSECSKRLETDVRGEVVETDDNTVVVVPNAPAAGYKAPKINNIDSTQFIGTGTVDIEIVDSRQVEENRVYEIHFNDEGTDGIDNDGDWIAWEDKADGIWNIVNKGTDDEWHEPFDDYGLDGLPDSLEPDWNPNYNPDPNHDNYSKYNNMIDRFDNDGDGLIDSADIVLDTNYVVDSSNASIDTLYFTVDTVYDDWGTENNHQIDWHDENNDGIYQKSESGEAFQDLGNGVRDEGEDLVHDVGIDGVKGTNDEGEGDGIPTPGIPGDPEKPGEPFVDIRDNDERVRNTTTFTLIDMTDSASPDTLIKESPWINGEKFNDFYHGMHIEVETSEIGVQEATSQWSSPEVLFSHNTTLFNVGVGGIPIPHDYKVYVVDSAKYEAYNRKMAPFYVIDKTTGDTSDFVYFPVNDNQKLSAGDKIIPLVDNYDPSSPSDIKGTWQIALTSKLPFVQQIFQDSENRLWTIASPPDQENYVGLFTENGWRSYPVSMLNGEAVKLNSIAEYVDGSLWFGTSNGIHALDNFNLENTEIDTFAGGDYNINSILVAKDGSAWFGSNSGLTHYFGPNNSEFYASDDSVFNSYIITDIYQDPEDERIWFGTQNGLLVWDGSMDTIAGSHLPDESVNTIESNQEMVLVGTDNGIGIYSKSNQSWTNISGSRLAGSNVRDIEISLNDSRIWVATNKGLSILESDILPFSEEKVTDHDLDTETIRSKNIFALHSVSNDTMWIGNHQGFDYYTQGEWKTTAPRPGDEFTLKTSKPYNSDDIFRYETSAASIDEEEASSELDDIAVVPNPYIAAASWEPKHLFTSGRGVRKIDFIHLPKKCTIKIFTIRGYLVKTIKHDASLIDGSESWDLTTKDGLDVAYGVYIYHVEAPGIGEKIGKFAIIK